MTTQTARHLSTISSEIAATRHRLVRARERLETRRAALEDARVRMLIAETPLADRELRAAADAHTDAGYEVEALEAALAELEIERRRLSTARKEGFDGPKGDSR